ncbi:benzoate-CoA ligase family protein [soil metagenome]
MSSGSRPAVERASRHNAAADLLGRNIGSARASRTYLRTPDRDVTYDEAIALAASAGVGLRDVGLDPGDRVVVATRDRIEFVATFWGAMAAGLVPVPVSDGLSKSDLEFILRDSRARVAVCDEATSPAVMPAARGAGVMTLFAGEDRAPLPEGAREWRAVCAANDATWRPVAASPDDVALWLYTSGTTGTPKAAMHRHRALRDSPAVLATQVLSLTEDDVVFSASKMFFAYGLGNSVYLPAAVGATVVVDGLPAVPARVSELIEREQPTVVMGVPAFFTGLVNLPDVGLAASVRALVSAGERLSPELFDRASRAFGRPPLDGLGATEALHHVSSNRIDDAVAGTAGRPLQGYEVRVRDREGADVADGKRGECWVRGPTTFAGYWGQPGMTDRVYDGDWMRTGDLITLLDGRIVHEGRLDDLMKLGGIWVAPSEIEGFLASKPGVREAAVVAVDDGDGVPALAAYVVLDGDGDGDAERRLRRACRGELAAFKVPRSVRIVPELPRTPTGKLQRHVLRESRSSELSG